MKNQTFESSCLKILKNLSPHVETVGVLVNKVAEEGKISFLMSEEYLFSSFSFSSHNF